MFLVGPTEEEIYEIGYKVNFFDDEVLLAVSTSCNFLAVVAAISTFTIENHTNMVSKCFSSFIKEK